MEKSTKSRVLETRTQLLARKLAADTKQAEGMARKAEAEAHKVETEAKLSEIDLRRKERAEITEGAGDSYHHRYHLMSSVNQESVRECIDQLNVWMRTDPKCKIEFFISSPGGAVIPGMALWDYIQYMRRQGHHFTTVALGQAASMGSILLQAGDKRVMGKESWLMLHQTSFYSSGSTPSIEDAVEWTRRIEEQIIDIFVTRSKLSRKKLIKNWDRKDWWISSKEAKKLGLVDEII